jgi:hypothetical protein
MSDQANDKIGLAVWPVARDKNFNKTEVNKRFLSNCILHAYGEQSPTELIVNHFGTSGGPADVINCAKCHCDR